MSTARGKDSSGKVRELRTDAEGRLETVALARVASVDITASTPLPDAGAYEADPASANMVAIPAGARRATITISYTRGAAGGAAAHKIFTYDGTTVAQVLAPDGSYSGIAGRASTGAGAISYTLSVDLLGGETRLGIASAETGVTGTPGSYASAVTFG